MKQSISDDNFRIKCLECGKYFKTLVTHLTRIHEMDTYTYKAKHKLPINVGLCCDETREKMRERANDLVARGVIGTKEQLNMAFTTKRTKGRRNTQLAHDACVENSKKNDKTKIKEIFSNYRKSRRELVEVECSKCSKKMIKKSGAYAGRRVPVCLDCQNNSRRHTKPL